MSERGEKVSSEQRQKPRDLVEIGSSSTVGIGSSYISFLGKGKEPGKSHHSKVPPTIRASSVPTKNRG